jgi:hypothetical protein
MDSDGRPFFQNAVAGNLSSEGALLSQISHPLKPGSIIGVQYGEKKARFEVVWVVDAGFRKSEVGIRILAGQTPPWHSLTSGKKDNTVDSAFRGQNKRKFPRHKVLFPIDIGFDDAKRAHMHTSATDMGGRGCYIETMIPLQLGTKINLAFWMDDEKVQTTGSVRASDPGVGMGIEFTSLDNHVQERLQAYLEKIDRSFAGKEAAAGG